MEKNISAGGTADIKNAGIQASGLGTASIIVISAVDRPNAFGSSAAR